MQKIISNSNVHNAHAEHLNGMRMKQFNTSKNAKNSFLYCSFETAIETNGLKVKRRKKN